MRGYGWPWAGVFGGGFCWYAAHDLGTYLSSFNCQRPWVTPAIHIVALIGALACGFVSYAAMPADSETAPRRRRAFSAGLNVAAAGLFALVILWQGIATLIFNGCAR